MKNIKIMYKSPPPVPILSQLDPLCTPHCELMSVRLWTVVPVHARNISSVLKYKNAVNWHVWTIECIILFQVSQSLGYTPSWGSRLCHQIPFGPAQLPSGLARCSAWAVYLQMLPPRHWVSRGAVRRHPRARFTLCCRSTCWPGARCRSPQASDWLVWADSPYSRLRLHLLWRGRRLLLTENLPSRRVRPPPVLLRLPLPRRRGRTVSRPWGWEPKSIKRCWWDSTSGS
jgi:hypothetical protein